MLPLTLLSTMLPVGTAMAQLAPPVECRSGGDAYEVIDPLFDAFMKKDHVPVSFTESCIEAGSFIAEKVVLDAPAAKWVPELARAHYPSADARDIRVRDLLAHSAGFVTDDPWGDRQLDMPDRSFAQLVGAGIPFARMPGLAHEYSNYGYALLGSIVGVAAGTRYQDHVRREVLESLGMKSSGLQCPP